MRYWLISTSPQNFAQDRAVLNFAQQGLKHQNRRMVQKRRSRNEPAKSAKDAKDGGESPSRAHTPVRPYPHRGHQTREPRTHGRTSRPWHPPVA